MTKIFIFIGLFYGVNLLAGSKSVKSDALEYVPDSIVTLAVSDSGFVLNFPAKPTKIVLGKQDAFTAEFIDSDVAFLAASPQSRSSVFVYVLTKRYAFDLRASPTGAKIVRIRDPGEKYLRVKVHE